MQPNIFTLRSGLTVILVDTKAFPTLTTILLFGAGSRYENQKNNGIAHFFEHMPAKGSRKYPSFFLISSLLEGLGAYWNAYTSKDHTAYFVKGTTEHFEEILDVLSDMVLRPLLDPKEIEREKGVIVEEINMYEDQPQRKVGELFEELLYNGNPLGFATTGTKETVTSFTRQTFVDYMQRFYHPDNAVLVVAGGLNYKSQIPNSKSQTNSKFKIQNSKQNYLHIIQEKFGSWQGKSNAGGIFKSPWQKVSENQEKPQTLIKYKKTEQSHFSLGFRTFSFFDPRRYALSLLTTILGGGASSRLFIEVRERRGLCYYISTGRETYHDVGYMVTQAGVTNDTEKIKQAVEVIYKEHKNIAKGEIKDEEFSRAKEMIKGRILLSVEDSANVASWYGTKFVLEKKIETVEEVLKKIAKVKKDEIVQLAKDVIKPENLNLALIGPYMERDLKIASLFD